MMPLEEAVSAALIEFLWQGAAVAAAFGLAILAMRRASVQSRYLLGCVALFGMVLMPFLTAWRAYGRAEGDAAVPATNWTLWLWVVGVMLFSLRLIWSLWRVRALRRHGSKPEARILEIGARMADRMKVARAFEIRIGSMIETAAVIGWWRPVVLLPVAAAAGLTVEHLEAVLAHEIAHIRRHDYLVNLVQVFAETLLFYHPAVWWVSAQIRRERELCCDEVVVGLTGDAAGYARALLALEKLRGQTVSVAVGSTGYLAWRIRRLLGDASGTEIWPVVLALAMTLACGTGMQRKAEAPPKDSVTVQVKYDDHGAINTVQVVNGPDYLRPTAIQWAIRPPDSAPVRVPELKNEPKRARVETITFPTAFSRGLRDRQLLRTFFSGEAAQAEKNIAFITGHSPADERNRKAAQAKLEEIRRKQQLARARSPEAEWETQILKHEVEEFEELHRAELHRGDEFARQKLQQMRKALRNQMRDVLTETH